MTTQTTTTFIGVVGRNENLFRETKSGDSAGGNQAIISDVARIPRIPGFSLVKICKNGSTFPRLRFGRLCQPFSLPNFKNYLSYEHASLLVLLKPFSPLKSLYPAIAATRCRCPRPCWSTWNWAKTAPGYPQGILYIYYFIAITI